MSTVKTEIEHLEDIELEAERKLTRATWVLSIITLVLVLATFSLVFTTIVKG